MNSFQTMNKRAAATFLQRFLGTDDALAGFAEEVQTTGDTLHVDEFVHTLSQMESSIADLIDYSRRLDASVKGLKSRAFATQMGKPQDV